MSKRASIESKVVTFFETAPLASTEIVLGIVLAKVKARAKAERPEQTKVTRGKKGKQRTNAAVQQQILPHSHLGMTADESEKAQ